MAESIGETKLYQEIEVLSERLKSAPQPVKSWLIDEINCCALRAETAHRRDHWQLVWDIARMMQLYQLEEKAISNLYQIDQPLALNLLRVSQQQRKCKCLDVLKNKLLKSKPESCKADE